MFIGEDIRITAPESKLPHLVTNTLVPGGRDPRRKSRESKLHTRGHGVTPPPTVVGGIGWNELQESCGPIPKQVKICKRRPAE